MKLSKKMVTALALATVAIAGTAYASWRVTTSTETITFGGSPVLAVTTTKEPSTPAVEVSSTPKTISVTTESPDASLANLIFRILGIPVSVQEVTTLKEVRRMGYGEITLA